MDRSPTPNHISFRRDRPARNFRKMDNILSNSLALDSFEGKTSDIAIQSVLNGEKTPVIPSSKLSIAQYFYDHMVGDNQSQRKDIVGQQRAIIFFSTAKPLLLAKCHMCNLSTVYRIKDDPLSACGLTQRAWKQLVGNLLDSASADYYKKMHNLPVFLPLLPEVRKPGRKAVFGAAERMILSRLLGLYPDLYLDEVIAFFTFLDPSFSCSVSVISKTLHRMKFSRKIPNRVLQRADVSEAKAFRDLFVGSEFYVDQLVFLDEACNARGTGMRTKSWAPRNVTPLGTSHSTGVRKSIIACINYAGIVDISSLDGTLDGETFSLHLESTVFPLMNAYPGPNSVLILDNCTAHNINPRLIFDRLKIKIRFLPPYCPFLNPIERMFSVAKGHICRNVHMKASLRGKANLLWIRALQHCNDTFPFRKMIEDVYIPDPDSGKITNISYK